MSLQPIHQKTMLDKQCWLASPEFCLGQWDVWGSPWSAIICPGQPRWPRCGVTVFGRSEQRVWLWAMLKLILLLFFLFLLGQARLHSQLCVVVQLCFQNNRDLPVLLCIIETGSKALLKETERWDLDSTSPAWLCPLLHGTAASYSLCQHRALQLEHGLGGWYWQWGAIFWGNHVTLFLCSPR